MAENEVMKLARKYLSALSENGISISRALLFGSYARNDFIKQNDIDLMIISPMFDKNDDSYYGLIWKLTKVAGYRIEPIPVGEKFFNTDTGSPVIEQAKTEGIKIDLSL